MIDEKYVKNNGRGMGRGRVINVSLLGKKYDVINDDGKGKCVKRMEDMNKWMINGWVRRRKRKTKEDDEEDKYSSMKKKEGQVYFDCMKSNKFVGFELINIMQIFVLHAILGVFLYNIYTFAVFKNVICCFCMKRIMKVLLNVEEWKDEYEFIELSYKCVRRIFKEIKKSSKIDGIYVTKNWVINDQNNILFIGERSELQFEMNNYVLYRITDTFSKLEINFPEGLSIANRNNRLLNEIGKYNNHFYNFMSALRERYTMYRRFISDHINIMNQQLEKKNKTRSRIIQQLLKETPKENMKNLYCKICYCDKKISVRLRCNHFLCCLCCTKLEKNECPFCRREIDIFRLKIFQIEKD